MLDEYKHIPREYKFDYLRTQQRINEIRNKIKGFEPSDKEQFEWLKLTLKEYHTLFKHMKEMDEKFKQII